MLFTGRVLIERLQRHIGLAGVQRFCSSSLSSLLELWSGFRWVKGESVGGRLELRGELLELAAELSVA